jgi:hypothetical protein
MRVDMENQFIRAGVILAASGTWVAAVTAVVGIAAVAAAPPEVERIYEYGSLVSITIIALSTAYATYATARPRRGRLLIAALTTFGIGLVSLYFMLAAALPQIKRADASCSDSIAVVEPPPPYSERLSRLLVDHPSWGMALCQDGPTIRDAANETNQTRIVQMAFLMLLTTASFALSIIILVWGVLVNRDRAPARSGQ